MSIAQSRSVPDRIDLPANKDAITMAADWAELWARAHGLGAETCFAMRLCAEEAIANIVAYAYSDAPNSGRVAFGAARSGGEVRMTITDQGRPFDVASAPDPGRATDIRDAAPGGRGIRLMRGFSKRLDYGRSGDSNRLTLSFDTLAAGDSLRAGQAPGR